jgi:hypothetical protein
LASVSSHSKPPAPVCQTAIREPGSDSAVAIEATHVEEPQRLYENGARDGRLSH